MLMKRMLMMLPLLAAATAALAQGGEPPKATLTFDKTSAAAGSVVKGTLTLTFAEGLHGYQNPPSDEFQIPVVVKVVENGFKLTKVSYPKGTDFTMAGEPKPAKVYQGTIKIPIEVQTSTKPANYNVNVAINYQECNESSCFPPGTVTVKAPLTVTKAAKATKPAKPAPKKKG